MLILILQVRCISYLKARRKLTYLLYFYQLKREYLIFQNKLYNQEKDA